MNLSYLDQASSLLAWFAGTPAVLRKIAIAILASTALVLGGCHPAPDADYLRDYAQAHELLDAYSGEDDSLTKTASILDQLLKRQPDLPHAHVEMARLMMKRGHLVADQFVPGTLQDSERELRTAIALDSDFCDGYIVLGYVLYQMHKYPDSLKELDRADTLACTSPWRFMNRVDVDIALQRFDDAADTLAKVPAVLANSPPALRYAIEKRVLGTHTWIAFYKNNRPEMLELIREQVNQTAADDAWGMGNAAPLFVLAGAFDEAIVTAREALRRRQYGAAERSLGVALYGDSLWRSSRGASPQVDPLEADEWTEGESLVDFGDASKDLWGSLANRDVAFRALLQAKIMDYRSHHPKQAAEPAT